MEVISELPRIYVKKATADKHFLENLIWELEGFASDTAVYGFLPPEHLMMMFNTLRLKSHHKLMLLDIYLLGISIHMLRGKARRYSGIG